MADVEQGSGGPIPRAGIKPGPRLGAQGNPLRQQLMPEMKTGEAHRRQRKRPRRTRASRTKAGGGWNLGDTLTNPVTMAGLALLASNSRRWAARSARPELAAAKTVSERKRQKKRGRAAGQTGCWTERRVGVDEQRQKPPFGNQSCSPRPMRRMIAGRTEDLEPAARRSGDNRNYRMRGLGKWTGASHQRQNADRLLKGSARAPPRKWTGEPGIDGIRRPTRRAGASSDTGQLTRHPAATLCHRHSAVGMRSAASRRRAERKSNPFGGAPDISPARRSRS